MKKLLIAPAMQQACGSITDRVKSYEDACAVLGRKTTIAIEFDDEHSDAVKGAIALIKLSTIREALNEGWKPDWTDRNQPKYYPWFEHNGCGFVLDSVYDYYQNTHVGSRLCYKNAQLAKYAATQFIDLYNDLLLLDK